MIRDANEADVEAIAQVHVTSWRETYPGIMPRELLDRLDVGRRAAQWRRWFGTDSGQPRRRVLVVCEVNDDVVGFASGVLPDRSDEGELETLYLLRSSQGHGHGRRLVADVAKRIQALGASSLMLWVADGNPTAGFYTHMGGVLTETKAKPFGPYSITEHRYHWHDISELTDLGEVV